MWEIRHLVIEQLILVRLVVGQIQPAGRFQKEKGGIGYAMIQPIRSCLRTGKELALLEQ